MADATLRASEQWHRRRGDGSQADPAPASSRTARTEQRSYRLDTDVGGQDEEAGGDELLRAALGTLRARPTGAEPPDDDRAGDRFDQAVEAEADQRDRRSGHARADRHSELERVP